MTTPDGAMPVPLPLTARVGRHRPEPGELACSLPGARGGSVAGRRWEVADGIGLVDEGFGEGRRR